MEAVALTGFLGAGKTTLTLALAEALAEHGARVAIVENERGGIGVDSAYLERQGLMVRELRAGCICCELVLPLRRTILALRDGFALDWLLVEASGVANADTLRETLEHPPLLDRPWRFVATLDAARFPKLWDVRYGLDTLIRPQVAQADVLVLTKIDSIAESQLLETAETVQELRPDAPVLPFAEGDALCIEEILRALQTS